MKRFIALSLSLLAVGAFAANVAVRFHGAGNAKGLPVDWPAETRNIGVSTDVPAGFDQVMTEAEYAAYRASKQADFDAWKASNEVARAESEINLKTEIQQAVSQLRSAHQNWDSLTAGQRTAAQKLAIRLTLLISKRVLSEGDDQ